MTSRLELALARLPAVHRDWEEMMRTELAQDAPGL
jgi:hypothetical protein